MTSLAQRQIAVVFALTFAVSCATAGGNIDTTVTRLAAYGERTSAILLQAQQVVEKATPNPIPANVTAKIQVEAFRPASEAGLKLTQALEVYDAFTPATDAAQRLAQVDNIRRVMQELRRYTRIVLVFTGNQDVGAELMKLYDNLEAAFVEIEQGIDNWRQNQ